MFSWIKNTMNKMSTEIQERLNDFLEGIFKIKSIADAEEAIWKLTYEPEKQLKSMGLEKATDDAKTIRAEIALQCKKNFGEDWRYGVQDLFLYSTWRSFKNLQRPFLGDKYVIEKIVFAAEKSRCLNEEEKNKLLACLNSKYATSHVKGMKMLGFKTEEEIDFLIPYRTYISSFLQDYLAEQEKIMEQYMERETAIPEECAEIVLEVVREEQPETTDEVHEGKTDNSEKDKIQKMIYYLSNKNQILEFLELMETYPELVWVKNHMDVVCKMQSMLETIEGADEILKNQVAIQNVFKNMQTI